MFKKSKNNSHPAHPERNQSLQRRYIDHALWTLKFQSGFLPALGSYLLLLVGNCLVWFDLIDWLFNMAGHFDGKLTVKSNPKAKANPSSYFDASPWQLTLLLYISTLGLPSNVTIHFYREQSNASHQFRRASSTHPSISILTSN